MTDGNPGVARALFGKADGQDVYLYTLTGRSGMVAKVMTYGAILTELHVPDRQGTMADVVWLTRGGRPGPDPCLSLPQRLGGVRL